MVFSSMFFLFIYLPVFLLLYYLAPKVLKNGILLFFSLIFYAWGEPVYVVLMILSILINYLGGLEIEDLLLHKRRKEARAICIEVVVLNLLILGFYKYYGFLIDNINALLHIHLKHHELALPIGISFYTFQTLSYVLDVYKKKVRAQKNVISFGAYVSMFPQLIAGPIVRYSDVEKQLKERTISFNKFGEGAVWFIQGLGKKVLIANNIGKTFEAIQMLGPSKTSVLSAWIGCFAYTMQIYYDFGGYSDMAIGLGKMLGFNFEKNFNYPYIADSVTDFWRRWHISLGSWFREYVYIPLGGNRVSVGKHIRNLLVVWLLTGLWHGASWNFIAWGVYYGILLIFEKYVLLKVWDVVPGFVKHIYTMFWVMIGWMLFAASSLGSAFTYIGTMFGAGGAGFVDATAMYELRSILVLGIIAILVSVPYCYRRFSKLLFLKNTDKGKYVFISFYVVVLILSIAYLVNATYNPFLYFRF
ncbi:MAG: MBOAT family protein [Clostridiales bacterium]|nr:MBOAT family protein [Candidatus Blautia equi]